MHLTKEREADTDKTVRRNRLIHYHSWRPQHSSEMDRSSRQNMSEDIINQLDITANSKLLHPTAGAFFLSSCGTFTKMDHALGHKTHLKIF